MFIYKNGVLHGENVSLEKIAQEVGTPVYVYSQNAVLEKLSDLQNAFRKLNIEPLICYSVKVASNLSLLKLMADKKIGADIVSGGELIRVLKAGIEPRKIVFSGVGKSKDEIKASLQADILMFNVESEAELLTISEIATSMNKKAAIALRVNPDVEPGTHAYVATGLKDSKFGIPISDALELYLKAVNLPGIKIVGLDTHIGSQLLDLSPYQETVKHLGKLLAELEKNNIKIQYVDMGGGLGIHYTDEKAPDVEQYAKILAPLAKNYQLILEPGRFISGNSAVLLSQVVYNKFGPYKNFVIVDAAMNDLIRPSLYGSHHDIVAVVENKGRADNKVQIVGPVCESGDFLGKDIILPKLNSGEYLAVLGAGAYGFVMSSNYNSRLRAAEVLINGDSYKVIRKRENYQDLLKPELI